MSTQNRNRARITAVICLVSNISAFSTLSRSASFISTHASRNLQKRSPLFLRAPPGSGYAEDEDERSYFPDTYDPVMEYPGTMRPGSTPENQPFSSLPIQESDPDPVPWPHFQEIEWHHNWGSPHEAPIPMEDFIDMNGRWATAEMEAEMRAGARRGVRERREMEESQKSASFILDDDDEDDEDEEVKIDLGEGVNAYIETANDTVPVATVEEEKVEEEEEEEEDESEEDDSDDFLLDLGLDGGDDDDDDDAAEEEGEVDKPAFASGDSTDGILGAMQTMIDAEDSSPEASDDSEIDLNFDDLDLDFGDDDEDDETEAAPVPESGGEDEEFVMIDEDMGEEEDIIPLDDMIENEDMSEDDEFDDGGFDYD
jgi:hypothetical protein